MYPVAGEHCTDNSWAAKEIHKVLSGAVEGVFTPYCSKFRSVCQDLKIPETDAVIEMMLHPQLFRLSSVTWDPESGWQPGEYLSEEEERAVTTWERIHKFVVLPQEGRA